MNNLAMAFVIQIFTEFALTIQVIVLMYMQLVMAGKKRLVNALLHLKQVPPSTSLQTLAFLTVYIVVKGKEQSFITDNVILKTANLITISASTARILVKISYKPSQSLIQKNRCQTERTTFNCLQTPQAPTSLTTASLVAMKVWRLTA